MIFGHVWESEIYPPSLEINETLNQSRFFLCDHWVVLDEGIFNFTKKEIQVKLPDMDRLIRNWDKANDGSLDWYQWGPRVN